MVENKKVQNITPKLKEKYKNVIPIYAHLNIIFYIRFCQCFEYISNSINDYY